MVEVFFCAFLWIANDTSRIFMFFQFYWRCITIFVDFPCCVMSLLGGCYQSGFSLKNLWCVLVLLKLLKGEIVNQFVIVFFYSLHSLFLFLVRLPRISSTLCGFISLPHSCKNRQDFLKVTCGGVKVIVFAVHNITLYILRHFLQSQSHRVILL